MASGIQLNSTNNSEMNIVYQGTSGATRTVVMPDKSFTVAGTDEVIGVGQTWQDVKTSRAFGTTYTNSTGKSIQVIITSNGASNAALNGHLFLVNGNIICGSTNAYLAGIGDLNYTTSVIVQNGSTYSATKGTNTNAIVYWSELR